MTYKLFAACVLSLAFAAAANAQSAPSSSPEKGATYNEAQLKQMARTAHAPEQYKALAAHYGDLKMGYLRQAVEAKKDWGRLSQNVTPASAKYPTPAESARNRYGYYMYKANQVATLEARYSDLAAPGGPENGQ